MEEEMQQEDRNQVTFYASFFRAIRRIKKKTDRCDAYDAIFTYAFHGVLPDLDALPAASAIAFELCKPNLDSSKRKAESGKHGGSKPKANGKQSSSKYQAIGKQTASEKEEEGEKEGEIENECSEKAGKKSNNQKTRFVPPTVAEVAVYVQERGCGVDPQRFVDFYASKGWVVGKSPMKDWKAAVRNWEQRDKQDAPQIAQSAPDAAELARMQALRERLRRGSDGAD